jgi:hypothetical protein
VHTTAGPFDITTVSTVHATFINEKLPTGAFPGPGGGMRPKFAFRLFEQASASYRVADVSGAVDAAFSARPGLRCQALGACGTSGDVQMTIPRVGGRLVFAGGRYVRHRVSDRRAVADLLSGRLHASAEPYRLALLAKIQGTESGAGLPTCTDTSTTPLAGLVPGRGSLVQLDPRRYVVDPFNSGDEFRTRCAGPSASDIVPSPALATGSIPLRDVGDGQLTLVLRAGGSSDGPVYAVHRSGAITIRLALAHESGRTVRIRVYRGQGHR